MQINPFKYNFFEKNIFDLEVTIDTVHPVQISSLSDYCITTDILSLKNRGLVPTIKPEQDFSWTCSFR